MHEASFERIANVSAENYPEVFDGKLGTLPGTQTLRIKENARPMIMINRRVSANQRQALKEEIDRSIERGVTERVCAPTPWLSQLVVAKKKSGAVRICVDPHELNKVLLGEHYVIYTLQDVAYELRQAKIFSKADLSSGYWHVVLDDDSSNLTTF